MTLDSISPLVLPVNRLPQWHIKTSSLKCEPHMKCTDMLNGKQLCMGVYKNDNKMHNCSTTNCQHSMSNHAPKWIPFNLFLWNNFITQWHTPQLLQQPHTIYYQSSQKIHIFLVLQDQTQPTKFNLIQAKFNHFILAQNSNSVKKQKIYRNKCKHILLHKHNYRPLCNSKHHIRERGMTN